MLKADATDSTHVQNRCYKALKFQLLICSALKDEIQALIPLKLSSLPYIGLMNDILRGSTRVLRCLRLVSLLSTIMILYTAMRT